MDMLGATVPGIGGIQGERMSFLTRTEDFWFGR